MWREFCFLLRATGDGDNLTAAHAAVEGLESRRFESDVEQYDSKAQRMRDQQLVEAADVLLAFWDGRSLSVARAIEYAHELRQRVIVRPC